MRYCLLTVSSNLLVVLLIAYSNGLQGFPSNQRADDLYTISIDDSSEVGSGESEDDEYYVQNIITKQETTPKKKVETTTPPVETDATSVTAGLDSSVLEEIRLLLANQKKALADVQSQVAIMSSRLDEQQISINQQDQLLAEHSNSIGELKGRQDRATSDIYTLQSAIVSHSRDKDQHLPSTTEFVSLLYCDYCTLTTIL
ncbi:hypothetical protein EB796_004496 [Bugula neritina]|uniref:Uncharacterized protein n=1 Tax=Bugula neritina TaxID=10212 RepID=A0A7J7KEW4_BUGNE|nr:hypothetical protein EB796_004496 [Bugula neritina]